MGVASSNIATNNNPQRIIATNNNPQTYNNRPQQVKEGFFTDPQQAQASFFNSQFLEYGVTQPNLFIVPATNYSNAAANNINRTNQTLNDSIFGNIRSIYGTTNTAVITPSLYGSYKENRSNIYSNYYDGSKDIAPDFSPSRQLSNTESKKQFASPLTRIFDFIKPDNFVPEQIIRGQNFCETYNSLSNNVEEYYANKYERTNEFRCGFIYNPNFTDPVTGITGPVFRGHYGNNTMKPDGSYNGGVFQEIYNASLLKAPGSELYWEMNDTVVSDKPVMGARKAFKKYFCQIRVPACSNVDAYNSQCVWSQGLGRAVPAAGQPGYYNRDYFRITNDSLYPDNYYNIITTSACNACGTVTGTASQRTLPESCYNGQNPYDGSQIPKACLQSLLANARCSDGAIGIALNSGTLSSDYGIKSGESFIKYRQVYPSIGNLFTNSEPILQAQTDINTLGLNASNTEYTSINYAARDLCRSNGAYSNFDFCTEYTPTTTATTSQPFLLKCVQQEFRVRGGQKTGLMYPESDTDSKMAYFNSLGTWQNVKSAINQLALDVKSTDINTQAVAFNNFYGINAQQFISQFIPTVRGIEVFWFSIISATGGTYTPSVFLGRRIQQDLTLNTNGLPNTGIQFVSFFNLKTVNSNNTSVQYSFSNTDGIKILENQNIGTETETTGKYMAAWTNSSNSRVNTNGSNCWPVSATKPNYFTVSWYRGTGTGSFNQNYFKTCDATPSNVNGTGPIMTMSQEEDAPMISFQVVPDPTANQISFFSSEKIITYVFGDSRLWKIMPITDSGSATSINTSTKFGFSNRYYGTGTTSNATNYSYLYGSCRFTSGSCRQTSMIIQNQSWRTMTMLFKTGNLTEITNGQTRYLLQYGELSLGITRTDTPTLGITSTDTKYNFSVIFNNTTTTVIGTNLQPNTTYYLIVIQDFGTDSQSTKTTTLRACCADIARFTSNANLPFVSDGDIDGNRRYYNSGNGTPLWTKDDINYFLRIGGTIGSIAQTVIMDVGWVRFFDYVFTSTDLTNDMTNNWLRSWWNMV
jgi:hypothetical protein